SSEIGDRPSGELYGERLWAQTPSLAHVASRRRHILGHPLTIGIGAGLLKISFKKFQYTLEAKSLFADGRTRSSLISISFYSRGGIPVQQKVLNFCRIFFKRSIQGKAVRIGAKLERPLQGCGAGPRPQSSVKQRPCPIHHNLCRVEIIF